MTDAPLCSTTIKEGEGVHCSREFFRRTIGQAAVRPGLVVVDPPRFDLPPRIGQVLEPVRIQALIPKASVETLDVAVLYRLAGLDVDQRYAALLGPRDEAPAREFRTVVEPKPSGFPRSAMIRSKTRVTRMPDSEVSTSMAGDFLGEIIHHGQRTDRAAVGQRVGDEIDRPLLVGPDQQRHADAASLASRFRSRRRTASPAS